MVRMLPVKVEPELWYVAFHKTTPHWWLRWLPGYKHVSAFAFVRELELWIVYDLCLNRTRIVLLPDTQEAHALIENFAAGADLVRFSKTGGKYVIPMLAPFCCVPAIAHLLGLPPCVALTPSGLYRWLIRNGGEPHGRTAQTAGRRGSAAPAGNRAQ